MEEHNRVRSVIINEKHQKNNCMILCSTMNLMCLQVLDNPFLLSRTSNENEATVPNRGTSATLSYLETPGIYPPSKNVMTVFPLELFESH